MYIDKKIKTSAYHDVLSLELRDDRGAWRVETGAGVRRYAIEGSTGEALGELYGLVLSPRDGSGFVIDGDRIRMKAPIAGFHDFETRLLDRMRGSFAAMTGGALAPRLYPDCSATLPIVFCPGSRRAGTSAAAIFDEDEYRDRLLALRHRVLVERRGVETWIPGTLTAHQGVVRLLPNHYLDLTTWKAVRFWPRSGEFNRDSTAASTAVTVAAEVSDFIRVASNEHRAAVALTAGYDSRLMAAACRGVADRVEFYTLAHDRPGMDDVVARALSERLGLRHRLYPFVEATRDEQEAWDRATGHTIRHANRRLHPSARQIDCDLILTGLHGETGRARLYRTDFATVDRVRPTAEMILKRMSVPVVPEILGDVEAWLAGVDWLPFSAILDLAFLEMCYLPLFRPAQFAQKPELMPYTDRAVQTAFLSTPPHEKGEARVFDLAIRELWPEALSLPVNRYGDYRDLLDKMNKLSQPDRVIPYVQRRFAERFRGRG